MENQGEQMTQHNDKVEAQRQRLDKEKLDGQITMLDIRKGRIETRFASGRVVIEYPRDKRKKTKVLND
tara:strand:- start:180 stop:383 length:204 start_codon:yes stop_codon:yes gene_type:complete